MRHTINRVLAVLLALLLAGAMLSAAMAEGNVVANATKKVTTYVGMQTKLTIKDRYGDPVSPTKYSWKSSKKAVATVTSKGVVTAVKSGTATITATSKSNSSNKFKVTFTVKKNQSNPNTNWPSATSVQYETWDVFLRGLEVVSPTRVDAEYFMVCNFPSNWQVTKFKSLKDRIRVINRSTDAEVGVLVDGYASTVYNFKHLSGRFVQVIKVAYKGSAVGNTNFRLNNYKYKYYPEGVITRTIH